MLLYEPLADHPGPAGSKSFFISAFSSPLLVRVFFIQVLTPPSLQVSPLGFQFPFAGAGLLLLLIHGETGHILITIVNLFVIGGSAFL